MMEDEARIFWIELPMLKLRRPTGVNCIRQKYGLWLDGAGDGLAGVGAGDVSGRESLTAANSP